MSEILRKYNVLLASGTAGSLPVRVSIRTAAGTAFATGSDWTPAAGDVKVSKDGGAEANIGSLPSYSNGAWEFILTATELTARMVRVRVDDAAVEPFDFTIVTFGNASAMYPTDYINSDSLGLGYLTGDAFARLGAPAGASTAADIAAAKAVADAINAKTTNLPASPAATGDAMALTPGERVTLVAAIEAEIADDVTGEAIKQAIIDKLIENLPDLDDLTLAAIATSIRTELAVELARIDASVSSRLATAGYTAPDNASAATAAAQATTAATQSTAAAADAVLIKAVTVKLNDTLEDDAGTYRFSTNALEQAPGGGGGALSSDQDAALTRIDRTVKGIASKRE